MNRAKDIEANRRVSAATKAAGGAHYVSGKVSQEDFYARLAEIPPDTRSLTQRLCGDPLPGRDALSKSGRAS